MEHNIFVERYGDEKLSNARMSIELIDSIKTISARIDELKMIVKQNGHDRRQGLVKRVERLMETRMKLIYSFMDINPHYVIDKFNPFNGLGIKYSQLPGSLRNASKNE